MSIGLKQQSVYTAELEGLFSSSRGLHPSDVVALSALSFWPPPNFGSFQRRRIQCVGFVWRRSASGPVYSPWVAAYLVLQTASPTVDLTSTVGFSDVSLALLRRRYWMHEGISLRIFWLCGGVSWLDDFDVSWLRRVLIKTRVVSSVYLLTVEKLGAL